MSDLRQAVTDYLSIRRALGFQLRGYDRLLGDLVMTCNAPRRRR
jgi:hypothetical protein